MTQTETRPTKELFRAWRSGDASAGQAMAQRFADWYYAIATSRLGEERGRGPCESACQRFGTGIVEVTEARALVGWAHGIIQDELSRSAGRAHDGDEANAYTGGKRPKALIAKARKALPAEVDLLIGVYSGSLSDADAEAAAASMGGIPIGTLRARYRLKQWLRTHADVPFEVTPEEPNLDRAPMPLYESGRMSSPAEEASFEQWMVTDLDLCRDIAEFAHFSIALRGGLSASTPIRAPRAMDEDGEKTEPIHAMPAGAVAPGSSMRWVLVGAAVLFLGLLLVSALGVAYLVLT